MAVGFKKRSKGVITCRKFAAPKVINDRHTPKQQKNAAAIADRPCRPKGDTQ